MTARATRIYVIAAVMLAVAALLVSSATPLAILWIVPVQLVPFALVGANLLLAPFEAVTQRRYWREARYKLLRTAPMVIAITG